MSTMSIDTTLTPSHVAHDSFSYALQNSIKNEIVSKFNAAVHLITGHNHDGVNSRSLSGGGYTLKELEALILMGVMK